MATMEQIAEEVGGVDLLDPGGPLDQKITDEHILSVSDFMTDWETVASHLGVGDVTVDEIKQNSSSAKKKKEDMLKAWRSKELKNATYRRLGAVFLGLQKTDCTEKILKLALELSVSRESPEVTVLKKMLKTILSFSHACSSITTDDFAQKLVENHLTTWPETSDRYHMAKFMKEVIKQVELDKENFTTFLKILEEESVFCSLHNMIQREYDSLQGRAVSGTTRRQPFCGCGNCYFEQFCRIDCPSSGLGPKFQCLYFQDLEGHDKNALIVRLTKEMDTIQSEFDRLLKHLYDFAEARIKLDEFKVYVQTLEGLVSTHETVPLLTERAEEIDSCSSVSGVLTILNKDYFSWFSFKIIQRIVGRFAAKSNRIYRKLEKYEKKFISYCKRSIFEFPQLVSHVPWEGKCLFLKSDLKHRKDTLDIFLTELACKLNVNPQALNLVSINKGCVLLVLSLPSATAKKAFPLSLEQEQELLALGVQRLFCNGYYFNDQLVKERKDVKEMIENIEKKANPENTLQQEALMKSKQQLASFESQLRELGQRLKRDWDTNTESESDTPESLQAAIDSLVAMLGSIKQLLSQILKPKSASKEGTQDIKVSEDGLQQQLVGSMQLPVQDKTPQKEVEVVSKEQVNKGQLKQLKVSEEDPSVPTKVDQQGLPKNENTESVRSSDDEIKDKLKTAKLDPNHWFKAFKALGVTMPEQLDDFNEYFYNDLKEHVRHKVDDMMLKKFLGMVPKQKEDIQKSKVVPVRETMEKKLQTKLKQAEEILTKMKDLLNDGKCRQEKIVKKCENDMQEVLEISSDAWIAEEKPLSELITGLQDYIVTLHKSLMVKQDIPDSKVLSSASDGLALRGVLLSKKVKFQTEKRSRLLRVPENVKFVQPHQLPYEKMEQFTSKDNEIHFSKTVERFGYNAALAKSEVVSPDHTLELPIQAHGETKSEARSKKSRDYEQEQYYSTVKYNFIPTAAFQFEDAQLQLSVDAVADLKSIEKIVLSAPKDVIQRKCEEFFKKYGSHAIKGVLHFGGSYQWQCSSEGFEIPESMQVMQLQEKVVSVTSWASKGPWSYSGLDWLKVHPGDYSKTLKDQIQFCVAINGGHEKISEFTRWKIELLKSSSTWSLIDCGMETVPVWKIIQMNYRKEFSNKLVHVLVRAWERMTKLKEKCVLSEILAFNEDDVLGSVTEWNKCQDISMCKKNLIVLLKAKHKLTDSKHPRVWLDLYLSAAPVQQYLIWVVQLDLKQDFEVIKSLLRQLVEPSDFNAIKSFPGKASIFKWIYQINPMAASKRAKYSSMEGLLEFIDVVLHKLRMAKSERIQKEATFYFAEVINNLYLKLETSSKLFLITLLYPLSYDVEKCFFEFLLAVDDFKYFSKELKYQLPVFQKIQSQGSIMKLQAYLFHLTVSFLNNRVDTNFQERCINHLQYLYLVLEPNLDAKLRSLLSKTPTTYPRYNWPELQQNLLRLLSTEYSGSQCFNFFKELHLGSKHELIIPNFQLPILKVINCVLDDLGLDKYYPQKLKRSDALCIYQRAPESIGVCVLQEIMMHNYEYWKCLLEDDSTFIVHPVDALLALLLCSDNFLRQDLLGKMATCQLAIPLLLPDPYAPQPDSITLPLWGMRSVVKEWKCKDPATGDTNEYECCMVEHEIPLVSFMRFSGSDLGSTLTKSKILNAVIGASQHNYFFHFDCEGGDTKRELMEGVVDLCWYLPAGKDDERLPEPVAFTNLRGDAQNHMLQFSFLQQVSFMTFVLLTKHDLKEDNKVLMLEELSETPGGLVLLFSDLTKDDELQVNSEFPELKDCKIIKMKNRSLAVVNKTIQSYIVENLKKLKCSLQQFKTLKTCSEIARQIGIHVDEDDPECCAGQQLAQNIMKEINRVRSSNNVKDIMLPLQSQALWHEWSKCNKEQHRRLHKGDKPVVNYNGEMEDKKEEIRKQQLLKTDPPTPVMKLFLSYLLQHKGIMKAYFLQWLKFLLDKRSQQNLPHLLSCYENCKRKLQKASEDADESDIENIKKELAKIKFEMNVASLGLEHLFREIGQMYESVMEVPIEDKDKQVMEDLKSEVSCLPAIAAELLVAGYPLELMDGDASHVPMTWVRAVLDNLNENRLKHAHLFVVSVLGIQSSGKSTLLNTMFGIRFAVSAGRCTRGAFIQLLQMQKCSGPSDYLLVVDTEGLRAPELDSQKMLRHDNEMAAFVIGLANITIINIKGETPSDIQDILQTSVHAFIRMKKIELNPSCQFIHQNVASVIADTKLKQGKTNLVENLDQMVQYAAKQQQVQTKYTVFNQVVSFNVEKDVWYFPSLWKGSPPMVPVNPGYSEMSKKLKAALIHFASEKIPKFTILDFKNQMNLLWGAVLDENFVFSFKNMLEMTVYSELDSNLGKWCHELRSEILKLQTTLENTVYSCDLKGLDAIKTKVIKQLNQRVDTFQHELLQKLAVFCDTSNHADIMINWKAETERSLTYLCQKHRDQTEKYCITLIHNRRAREKLDKLRIQIYQRIQGPVRCLATRLKGQDLKEEALREEFDKMWAEQIATMTFKQKVTNTVEFIGESIEHSLLEIFGRGNESKVAQKLSEHGSKSALHLIDHHVTVPNGFWSKVKGHVKKVFFASPLEKHKPVMEQVTQMFLRVAKYRLDDVCKNTRDYSDALGYQVLMKVVTDVEQYNENQENFNFTDEYKIDLCIVVGGIAFRRFVEITKRNDPYTIMENLREPSYIKFKSQVLKRKMEVIVANSLSFRLRDPIKMSVIDCLVPLLKDRVASHERFQSKHCLLYNIMLDLEKKEDFKCYSLHLTNVEQSMRDWIQEYTMQYCTAKEGGQTKLQALATSELKKKIKHLTDAATDVITTDLETLKDWIKQFQYNLASSFHLNLKELLEDTDEDEIEEEEKESMEEDEGVNEPDFKYFVEEFIKEIKSEEEKLASSFIDLHTQMGEWKRQPYAILANDMIGCCKQCPFCGTKCELINPDHPGDLHRVSIHRPECLGGFRWEDSEIIVLDVCTESVKGDNTFHTKETDGEFVPYNKYRDIYKDWLIVPNSSRYDSSYWKYFVAHFTDEIVEYFGTKKPPTGSDGDKILQEWKKLEWDKVKKDLKDSFGL